MLARLGALPPVTGPPLVMGYRDDNDLCCAHSVIDAEGKPRENEPPRSMFRYWIPRRCSGNLRNSLINFLCKCRSAHGAMGKEHVSGSGSEFLFGARAQRGNLLVADEVQKIPALLRDRCIDDIFNTSTSLPRPQSTVVL